QSYVTLSVQTTRYQNVRLVALAETVKVCATELSPLNGPVLPTLAEPAPLCDTVEVATLPEVVQPVRPLSKPPLVTPVGGGGDAARRRGGDRERDRGAVRGARRRAGHRDRVRAGGGGRVHAERQRRARARRDRGRVEARARSGWRAGRCQRDRFGGAAGDRGRD